MCFWVHDKSVLFSHLCKTIFTVQYIVYGIFLDISQIITTRYTILLSCHQKKNVKNRTSFAYKITLWNLKPALSNTFIVFFLKCF